MARVHNGSTVTTSGSTLFSASTNGGGDGNPLMSFRVTCLSGVCKVWAPPLLSLSQSGTLISGVVLSAANANNTSWAPVSDIYGPFTSVRVVGVGASCKVAFRPEMGAR